MRRGAFDSRALIRGVAWLWAAFFCVACVLLPLAALIHRAAFPPESVGLPAPAHPGNPGNLEALLDPVVLSIARFTAGQAALSTAISALIALPLGLRVGAWRAEGSHAARWAQLALAFPFGVPTAVAGMAFVSWLGRSGPLARLGVELDWLYSLKAVVLAHVFLNAPWLALLVSHARAGVPRPLLEAARSLGASGGSRFRFVVWPYVRRALLSGMAQVFALCAMSFALVLLLGGGPPVQTLETAIYSRMRYGFLDVGGAVACAFWQLALASAPWILLGLARLWARAVRGGGKTPRLPAAPPMGRRAPGGAEAGSRLQGRPGGRLASAFAAGAGVALCAAWSFPYVALLAPGSWARLISPDLLPEWLAPLAVSLRLAAAATALAVVTALAAILASHASRASHAGTPRWGRALPLVLSLPSGISVLVLGLGFWLAYGRWIDPFDGSFLAMAALQGTLFFPLAFRALWPVAQGTQARLLDAAATLGASPIQAFRLVEWPRWKSPVASASAVIAAASLGEVAAVSLFYSEDLVPLPLLMTRWMAQYRFEDARAVATLLLALSGGALAWIAREEART